MKKLLLLSMMGLIGTVRSMDVPSSVVVRGNDGQEQTIAREDFERIVACVSGLPKPVYSVDSFEKVAVQLADDLELTIPKKDFDLIMSVSSATIREFCQPIEGKVFLVRLTKEGLECLIKYRSILSDEEKLHGVVDALCHDNHYAQELALLLQAGDFLGIEPISKVCRAYLLQQPDNSSIRRRLDHLLELEQESDRQVVIGLLRLPPGVFYLPEIETHYALKAAARNNSQEITTLLLERDAEERAQEAACCVAAGAGHKDIVRLLLEQGTKNHCRVLLAASRTGQTEMVKYLFDRGIPVDSEDEYGSSALMYAARYGHARIGEFLVGCGVEIDRKNKLGNNALLWASMNGHTEMVRFLLDQGACIDAQNIYGNTPLMEAVRNGHYDTVRLLLERKARVDLQDSEGLTALMKAAGCGSEESFWHLFNAGASTDLTDNKGNTAAMLASRRLSDARWQGYGAVARGCELILYELNLRSRK